MMQPPAGPGAGAGATLTCNRCGGQNPAGTAFCGHCGTPLATAAPATLSCPRCGAVNPAGTRYCGSCGQSLAAGAAVLPVQGQSATPVGPLYRMATPAQFAAVAPTKNRSARPWLVLGGSVLALMVVFGIASNLLRPTPPAPIQCPPQCAPPPRVIPLAAPHEYTSSRFGYSLEYYGSDDGLDPKPDSQDGATIRWTVFRSTKVAPSPVQVTGEAQQGRTPQQIVDALQRSAYGDARLAYQIPGAEAGYNGNSYGAVYDVTQAQGTGQFRHLRLIIVASVKNGVAVDMLGIGPYLTPKDFSYDQPNPSLTPLADFMDRILNTITWKGDPPL